MFIRSLREELYRGFHNRGMYTAWMIGIVFVILHVIFGVRPYAESYIGNLVNIVYPCSVFHITLMFGPSAVYSIYYSYIFPLLAVLPFAVSYYEDCRSKYRNQLLMRGGVKNYLWSKYLAVFITAGTAVTIPLLLDLMITMTCIPALRPQPGTMVFPVSEGDFMGSLFYTHPFLYVFFYLLLLFCLAGILASVSLAVSVFVTGKYLVLFIPFIFTLMLESIQEFTGWTDCGVFEIVIRSGMNQKSAGAAFALWPMIAVTVFFIYYRAGGKRYDKI